MLDGRDFLLTKFWRLLYLENDIKLRSILKQSMKKLKLAQSDLVPALFIKSKHPEIPVVNFHPYGRNDEEKDEAIRQVHQICKKIDAKEVLVVGTVNLIIENRKPPQRMKALVVIRESAEGFQNIAVPFKRGTSGKITFGQEVENLKAERHPRFSFEGFIH